MLPAHKDLKNPPGQVENYPKCTAAQNGGCFCDGSCFKSPSTNKEQTLKDYIQRKEK